MLLLAWSSSSKQGTWRGDVATTARLSGLFDHNQEVQLTMSFIKSKSSFVLAALLCLCSMCTAQFVPASPPLADPKDHRFDTATEDWSSPALGSSHLEPVGPLSSGAIDKHSNTLEIVRVQWRWGDPIDLYIMKPKGVKKPPVVLYLYDYRSDVDRFSDEKFQERATRNGVAAVGFVSDLSGYRYHDRPMKEWFVSNLQECLAVSAHDVQMILNYLEQRGDFDMERVGMFAQDSGASIAILASAVDPRIKVLDLVDPWADWPDWLAQSPIIPEEERKDYLTPEFLKSVAALDPVDWFPKVKAKQVRLQDAVFALSTPKVAKDKLRSAAPAGATVIVYKTPEETKTIAQDNNVLQWMEQQLQALSKQDPTVHVAKELPAIPAKSSAN